MEDSIIEKKARNKNLLMRHGVYLFLLISFLVGDTFFNSRKVVKDFLCLTYFNYIFNLIYYLFCIIKKDSKKYTGKFLYNFLNFCFNLSFALFFFNIIDIILKNHLFFNFSKLNSPKATTIQDDDNSPTDTTTEEGKTTSLIFENIFEIAVSLIIVVMNYIEIILNKKEDKSNLRREHHFVILLLIFIPLLIIDILFNKISGFNTTDYLIIIIVNIVGFGLGQYIYQCSTKTKKIKWSDENSDEGDSLTELEDKK